MVSSAKPAYSPLALESALRGPSDSITTCLIFLSKPYIFYYIWPPSPSAQPIRQYKSVCLGVG